MTALDLAEYLVHRMSAADLTPEALSAHSGIPLRTVLCYVEQMRHADLEAAARVLTLFELAGTRLRQRSHRQTSIPHVTKPNHS